MTTAEVLRVLDADEACARILAAGYTKKSCAACQGVGSTSIVIGKLQTGETISRAEVCRICDGAGFTWEKTAPVRESGQS